MRKEKRHQHPCLGRAHDRRCRLPHRHRMRRDFRRTSPCRPDADNIVILARIFVQPIDGRTLGARQGGPHAASSRRIDQRRRRWHHRSRLLDAVGASRPQGGGRHLQRPLPCALQRGNETSLQGHDVHRGLLRVTYAHALLPVGLLLGRAALRGWSEAGLCATDAVPGTHRNAEAISGRRPSGRGSLGAVTPGGTVVPRESRSPSP